MHIPGCQHVLLWHMPGNRLNKGNQICRSADAYRVKQGEFRTETQGHAQTAIQRHVGAQNWLTSTAVPFSAHFKETAEA